MSKKLYVGNIAFSVREDTIRDLFGEIGEVLSVRMITDRETGRFRGFGFIEMGNDDADRAIEQFNGYELEGRSLRVSEARERKSRGQGGFRRSNTRNNQY